jgi:hypothetical protein
MKQNATISLLALLVFCAILPAPCPADDLLGGKTVVLEGFETRGTDKDGKPQWELHGEKARLRGGQYRLEDILLAVYLEQGGKATITSPRCVFDQARGIASSDAPLRVKSEEMTLQGEGYDFSIERRVLRIRSHVTMNVKKVGDHMSIADVFGPLAPEEKPAAKAEAPESQKDK